MAGSENADADINITVSGFIADLAAVQTSIYPRRAYQRAARAVALLEQSLNAMTPEAIAAVPDVGRTALQVITEVLATGEAPTVTRRLAASGPAADADRRRSLKEGFLSLAAARAVLAHPAPGVIGRRDYRGDVQMHSQWSDGARSIAAMALACVDRGYKHLAITDHSKGLSIARGLSSESLVAQHREIDALNAELDGRFRVFKGIEANIGADGSLDVSPAELRACELVLAAPHSKLDSTEDQTTRLIKAVKVPGVHVLAHPSGRKFGKRAGLRVNWDRVFTAAVEHDVAVELDGDPSRQDLHFALVSRALDAGCLFAIDSDAHDTDQLVYSDIALAHARLAGVPAARVINCWPTKKLAAWLRRD
jgi:histidinol phosphatase-like PHP family hydrolase